MNESGPAQRELPGPGTGNEVPMRAKRNDEFDYTAYLQSPEWRKIRTAAVERAGGRCQLCNGAKYLHVHHRTYARIGNEEPGDLTVLCRRCHAKHHNILPNGPTKGIALAGSKPRRPSLTPAVKDALTEEILANVIFRTQTFTSKELAKVLNAPPHHVGATLSRMRKDGLVTKQGKRWSRRATLRVSARSAAAAAKREAA